MISLREHQVEAVSQIRKWTGFPVRASAPAQGLRGTVVSATGSGKTITAAWAARECFRGGRILVMVPTLDLLVQTAQAWRRVGHHGPMAAVCSLEKDEVLEQLGVRTTTNAIQLALWAGKGPVVVFATYASLVDREDPEDVTGRAKVRGPLEAALAGGQRLYGQTMDGFDLAVIDEAHSTTGDLGRPWAAIHDNSRIPADFRLYLTATPRILASPVPRRARTARSWRSRRWPATRTDHTVNGCSSSACRRRSSGASSPGSRSTCWRSTTPPRGRAVGGGAARAAPGAAADRTPGARRPAQPAHRHDVPPAGGGSRRLRGEDAADGSPAVRDRDLQKALAVADALPTSSIGAEFYELEAGRHVPPERVWSAWLCGDHLVAERREVLRQFADGLDAGNKRVHRAFLASVRVLGEGVDIVGERGVEAICFADTRGSQVEIVQNIGRALRPNPDGTNKTARIIVPVFLKPGEDPTDMVASASFAPLVAVLQGLRSHSERLVEQLASRALTSGQRHVHVKRDQDGRIIGTTAEGEGGQHESEGAVESALLHFSTPRDAATIAAFLRTRVYRPESLVWLEGYQALLRWRKDNHITGLHAVPYDTETEAGVTKAFPLGRWVHQQRRTYRAGELDPHRKTLLDEAGMVWEPGDEAWENKLAALRSYRRAHGHLAPRRDAVWGDADSELVPVGEHMANLRRTHGLGKNPERATVRAAQLASIDPDWNCPWPLDWQRHYRVLADLAADEPGGILPAIEPGVLFEGDDLGRWLQRQAYDWSQLTEEQQRRLSSLGVTPAEQTAPATTDGGKASGKASAFQRGLAALAQWIQREGAHKAVPRSHVEAVVIDGQEHQHKLGVWISNTKTRRDKLTHDQRAALAELGVEWA